MVDLGPSILRGRDKDAFAWAWLLMNRRREGSLAQTAMPRDGDKEKDPAHQLESWMPVPCSVMIGHAQNPELRWLAWPISV